MKDFTKFTGKHLYRKLFLIINNFTKNRRDFVAQIFSCEFCEIFEKTPFAEHHPAAALKRGASSILSSILSWQKAAIQTFFHRSNSFIRFFGRDVAILFRFTQEWHEINFTFFPRKSYSEAKICFFQKSCLIVFVSMV